MLHYIVKLHTGTHLMLGILTGDGPAPPLRPWPNMGMTRTYYTHDGIHLLQLEWSYALVKPRLKVQQ